jgi:glycosyltransferase involved in cell wall biosynthesis
MNQSTGMSGSGLRGAQIVHFAHGPWHDIWRTRQHIFSRLALENTVLYVEPKVYSLSALCRGRMRPEDLRTPRLQHEADGLWLYRHPVWAPRTAQLGLRQLTRRLRWLALRRAMARLGLRHPITWVFQPKDAELVGTLGERLIVCHVNDEYAAYRFHSPEKRQHILEGERRLLSRADLVIVTSHALLEAKAPLNPHIVLVPNGVDWAAFERVRQANMPPPEDIGWLRRPIVGYVGHISIRLDLPLLAEIARQRPDWSLALVGSVWETGCEENMAALRALPNVHFLGKKAPTEVPRYVYACDACLIPYCQGEEARYINPIKLYEYLAAGKPVVSVDIPALDGFRHVIHTASSTDTFVAALEAALHETEPALVEQRRRLAAENSWERRVEAIGAAVTQALRAMGCP